MNKRDWKITAIVFILLFFITLIFFVVSVKVGMNMEEKDNECFELCYNEGYNYYYDLVEKSCGCFDENDELVKIQKI